MTDIPDWCYWELALSRTDRLLKTLIREKQDLAVNAVDPLLSRISACIPRVRAAKHLGVSPDVFDRLKRSGQVRAAFSGEKVADLYDLKELDRLRHAVFSRAQIVHQRPPNSSRVAAAVRLVSVTCEEILAIIAEGKLAFVGQEPGNHNMCDLYVNRDELRNLVYGPERPLPECHFTINQARAVLYLNTMTIAWFMREGYIRTILHWSSRQRRHSRLIARAELAAFADQSPSAHSQPRPAFRPIMLPADWNKKGSFRLIFRPISTRFFSGRPCSRPSM